MPRSKRAKYPHFLPQDVPVWDAWLEKYADPSWHYAYDVKVGLGITPAPRLDDMLKQWAINITKKRIDVVITKPTEIVIVEVKTRAGMSSIAQLVSYPILYTATFNPKLPIRPMLVATKLLLDTEMLLRWLKIDYYVMNLENQAPQSPTTPRSISPEGQDTTK